MYPSKVIPLQGYYTCSVPKLKCFRRNVCFFYVVHLAFFFIRMSTYRIKRLPIPPRQHDTPTPLHANVDIVRVCVDPFTGASVVCQINMEALYSSLRQQMPILKRKVGLRIVSTPVRNGGPGVYDQQLLEQMVSSSKIVYKFPPNTRKAP